MNGRRTPVHVDEFPIGVQSDHQRRVRAVRSETGHRAPGIYDLPLVVSAGGRDREHEFKRAGEPYAWTRFRTRPEIGSIIP